jgi:hypothetical protein
VLLPYAIDGLIRRFALRRRIRSLLTITLFLTAITTMAAFAGIRADVFRREITSGPAVVIDTISSAPIPASDESSEIVAQLLRYAWISAAIGFELATALCWSNFAESTRDDNSKLLKKLERELFEVETQYLAALSEMQRLLSEPAETYARNWNDFRTGVSDALAKADGTVGVTGRLAGVILCGLLALQTARAEDTLHVVAGIDLSVTEKATGFGKKTEFDENKLAVSHLLASLPPGGRVSVIGITDQTVSSPFVLLSARLSEDGGYFGTRLARGRRDLMSEWMRRTADLKPTAPHSDVIGLFILASEIFNHSAAHRRIIVIFSDVRHEQPGVLDLERPEVINVGRSIKEAETSGLVPKLPGVQVYVLVPATTWA